MTGGITAAQATFGTSFRLAGNPFQHFLGMLIEIEAGDQTALGDFSDEIAATMDAGKAQFDKLGVVPTVGQRVTLTLDKRKFRIVRINQDEVSFEFLMKKEAQ